MRIEPGHQNIHWSRINSTFNEKKVFLVESGEKKYIGMTYEEIVIIELSGQEGVRRSQVIKSPQIGNRNAATEIIRDTFQPHRHVDSTDEYRLDIVYQRGKVTGEKIYTSGEIKKINREIPSNIFDSHSVELVLPLLPLGKDYSATLPAFHGVKDVEIEVNIQVTGREKLRAFNNQTEAWVVDTVWNDIRQAYWISCDGGSILRQVTFLEGEAKLEFLTLA